MKNPIIPGKETAQDHLLEQVPTASPSETVELVLRRIRSQLWATLQYIYVLDIDRRLVGTVSIRQLFAAANDATLSSLMQKNLIVVHPSTDQEHVGILAIQHRLKAVPVVTVGDWKFLGVVGPDQIMRVLHEEHTEDFLRMSGIQREHPFTDIFHATVTRLIRLRLPWLVVGMAGGMLATLLSKSFEVTLQQTLSLAFFIPIIVYMSDAVGTQTETLYVRALSIRQVDVVRYVFREFIVGLALSAVLGTLTYFFAVAVVSADVALVVGLAMILNVAIAPLVALVVPTILYALKKDPALGAGPFTTTIQDIISLAVYFIIATLILL